LFSGDERGAVGVFCAQFQKLGRGAAIVMVAGAAMAIEGAEGAYASGTPATQISSTGVYVVGTDIASGTWHTSGSGGTGNCYYATLKSTNTSDIIDNNNFSGPETVDLSGAYAFELQGPGSCTWALEGSITSTNPPTGTEGTTGGTGTGPISGVTSVQTGKPFLGEEILAGMLLLLGVSGLAYALRRRAAS
jgi:hypothetical protein